MDDDDHLLGPSDEPRATGERLRPLLGPDERVLWVGGPDPSRWRTSLVGDLLLTCHGAAFMLMAAAILPTATAQQPTGVRVLALAVALAPGAYLLAGRFAVKRYRARRTTYVLTDRRALVVTPRHVWERTLAGQRLELALDRDGRHLDVTIGGPFGPAPFAGVRLTPEQPWEHDLAASLEGTGIDHGPPPTFTFHDVLDHDGLRAALGATSVWAHDGTR